MYISPIEKDIVKQIHKLGGRVSLQLIHTQIIDFEIMKEELFKNHVVKIENNEVILTRQALNWLSEI